MALLSVRDVTLRFGGIVALDGVSFDVEEGHISGLIGPNGAGKTTAFNVITRLYKPDSGEVRAGGRVDPEDGRRTRSSARASRARSRTSSSSGRCRCSRTCSSARTVWDGRRERGGARRARVVGLQDRAHFPAAALPYGIQKRVELARALVAKPRLLLLDEPAGGLNHEEVGRARHVHQAPARRPRAHGAPRRAPHEPRHAHLRPRQRPELRPQDRRRDAGRGAGGPGRHRGVPRERGRRGRAGRGDTRSRRDAHRER